MVNCQLLRQILESENPRIYIFDRQGQRLIATLRVTFRFSRDRDGSPRIGFPLDVVFHDLNTCWQQRARQFGNNTVLRLRTLYAHELLQFAEWLKRYAELVQMYVTYCMDGTGAPQQAPQPQAPRQQGAPPVPSVPQASDQSGTGEEIEDIEQL